MRANWQAGKTNKQAIERETTKTSSWLHLCKKKKLVAQTQCFRCNGEKNKGIYRFNVYNFDESFFNASVESRFADRLNFGCRSGWNSLFL